MSLLMKAPAFARQKALPVIPADSLLYRYDASLDTLNTTYPYNAILPNQAASAYTAYGVGGLQVTLANGMQALKIKSIDYEYSSQIYISPSVSVAEKSITICCVQALDTSSQNTFGIDFFGRRGCATIFNSAVGVSDYAGNVSYVSANQATNSHIFLLELPSNIDIEPKKFQLYRNSALIHEVSHAADLSPATNYITLAPDIYNKSVYVHELAVWHRKLTTQEKTDMTANLMAKWGIV